MALTEVAVRNAKASRKAVKLSDGGGLHLLITPNGSRLWRMQYRFDGKQKQLSFGSYPSLSLKDARNRRDEARRYLATGNDPGLKAKLEKVARRVSAEATFRVVAEEYVNKLRGEGRAPRTIQKIEWLLSLAYPQLAQRPIADLSAVEILDVLRRVESRGRRESARRLRSTIGAVFRYAIASARATNDPTFALRGALLAPTVVPRAAVTEPKALGGLLRSIEAFEGQPTTKAALKLMALLFPRPGELRAAEWAEFDLAAAIWLIPAHRTKMRRPHRTPLPSEAVEILVELNRITGAGKLAFPSVRTVKRPISENTLNAALRRLGYTASEATAHGFRATASTLLNESGMWNPDAIERQLAHVEGNDVRRAYARGEHWEERVRMMNWWASYLRTLKMATS